MTSQLPRIGDLRMHKIQRALLGYATAVHFREEFGRSEHSALNRGDLAFPALL